MALAVKSSMVFLLTFLLVVHLVFCDRQRSSFDNDDAAGQRGGRHRGPVPFQSSSAGRRQSMYVVVNQSVRIFIRGLQ